MNPFPGSKDFERTPQEQATYERNIRNGKTTRDSLDYVVVLKHPGYGLVMGWHLQAYTDATRNW